MEVMRQAYRAMPISFEDVDDEIQPQSAGVSADRGRADDRPASFLWKLGLRQAMFALELEFRIVGQRLRQGILYNIRLRLHAIDAG